MRERHARSLDADQPVQAVKPGRVDAEGRSRRGDRGQPPGTSAQQRQGAQAWFQLADPGREHALELPGQRQRFWQRFGPGELGRAEDAWQFQQRQRMARSGRE
jgi:hypothetical protein